jgi:hypothetical protein
MNELRHDAQVQRTNTTPPHQPVQPHCEQLPEAVRTGSNVSLPSLSVLFALFMEQAQRHGAVPDPEHIYLRW